MSRKLARETVTKLVFEFLFTHDAESVTKEIFLLDSSFTDDDKEYISEVYKGVTADFDGIVAKIKEKAKGFSAERIYKADLAALCVAVFEMTKTDVPPLVSIDEAVEFVKKYSTEKSGSFVNGILGAVMKDVKGDNNG